MIDANKDKQHERDNRNTRDMAGFLEEFGCKDWGEWGSLYSRIAQEAWKFTYLEQAWKKINVDLDATEDCMAFCSEYKRIREEKDDGTE